MFLGPLFMVLLFAAVIGAAVVIVRLIANSPAGGDKKTPAAREILDQRFARGEIDKDEYEARRKVLGV
jgi:putative membrane protein